MIKAFDGFLTSLSESVSATSLLFSVADTGTLCSMAASDHAYFQVSDGTGLPEIIKVTGCSSGKLTVLRGQAGTTARPFIKGSCLVYALPTVAICELVNGGCGAVPADCAPVSATNSIVPKAVIGTPWVGALGFNNATALTVVTSPPWMIAEVVGQIVKLSGTPPADARNARIIVRATGCNDSTVLLSEVIEICDPVSV